jgi:hypothetical protein
MRRRDHAQARRWVALAAAVLIPLGAVTAVPGTATAAPTGPARLPHVAGGYVGGSVRVPATVARTGIHASAVPASVDLRAYAPPVGDQGQIGSCVAWTIAHGIMGYYAKRTGGVGAPYAPLFLYMRNVVRGGAPSAGLYPDAVLANAQAAGVDTQAHYWQGAYNYQTPPTADQIANATNYKITGWSRLFAGPNQGAPAQTVIQEALAAGSPVALSFPVYRDFMYLQGDTVYNTLSGTSLGGHMVTAFGYDAQGVWLRNSWGTSWGNRGDVKVSWAFITRVVDSAYTVAGIRTPAAPVTVAPTVAGLSVKKAAPGAAVTITGAGLADATAVKFGTQDATFSPVTAGGITKLVVTVPAQAPGAVTVTVTTPGGTSAAGTPSAFTVLPPAPVVTGITPATVSTAGGTTVTVTGTNLTGTTLVRIGGRAVPAKAVTATSLTFVAPARLPGTVDVTVSTPSGISAAAQVAYETPPPPAVTSLSPATGLTTAVTAVVINGTGLTGATRVTVDGRNVRFVRISDTSLRLAMAKHAAGTVTLQVTGPGGVSTITPETSFTYQPPPVPVINSLSATTGRTDKTTALTLTGTGLVGATRITVGGRAVGFFRVSDTELRFTAPPRAAGPVTVTVTAPGGTSTPVTFTYVVPAAALRATT